MTEVEVSPQPVTTKELLSNNPLAASAGNLVYGWYESSKNFNSLTQYTLGSVESSVKLAASAMAPVLQKMDKPIQAMDSYTANKLVMLEEKVPALKSQPEEVVVYLTESKDALTSKIADGYTAVSGCLNSGKEAVYSKISAGSEVVVNSRAGMLVSEGKKALSTRYNQGKETLENTLASGRDAVYSRVQSGAETLANSRAGSLVGSGVDRTLTATENWVEYLIPEIENEEELFPKGEPCTQQPETPADDSPAPAEDDEVEPRASRLERISTMSQKVKMRMYYRSVRQLQGIQQSCNSTLQQLKQAVDLLKIAQAARDGIDKQYNTVTSALKDLEERIKLVLSRQSNNEGASWLPKDSDEDVKIEWLNPKPQGTLQYTLDYAKQLSEKVFHTFQSVTVTTAYLPRHMKEGAIQAYQYTHEMYSTLKPVNVPTDLSASALNRISSVIETQLNYVNRLGLYLSSILKPTRPPLVEDTADSEGSEDSGAESGDEEENVPN